MTVQSQALLTLAESYRDLTVDSRMLVEGRLWSNPVICTQLVYDLAELDAEGNEAGVLQMMLDKGLLVIADDPEAKRRELAGLRPGYENRAQRRANRRAGKRK